MKKNLIVVSLATSIGCILSIYALFVEHQANLNSQYEAVCDIDEGISCSKVFTSEQGRIFSYLGLIPKDSIFDLPNALYGLLFYILYALIFIISLKNSRIQLLLLAMGTISMVLSAYLSYILSEVLQDICVICFSTYLCNFFLFITSLSVEHSNDSTKDNKRGVSIK